MKDEERTYKLGSLDEDELNLKEIVSSFSDALGEAYPLEEMDDAALALYAFMTAPVSRDMAELSLLTNLEEDSDELPGLKNYTADNLPSFSTFSDIYDGHAAAGFALSSFDEEDTRRYGLLCMPQADPVLIIYCDASLDEINQLKDGIRTMYQTLRNRV